MQYVTFPIFLRIEKFDYQKILNFQMIKKFLCDMLEYINMDTKMQKGIVLHLKINEPDFLPPLKHFGHSVHYRRFSFKYEVTACYLIF